MHDVLYNVGHHGTKTDTKYQQVTKAYKKRSVASLSGAAAAFFAAIRQAEAAGLCFLGNYAII